MKILVCGAGIHGSFLASHLYRRGGDVTLLARGSRFDDYRNNGIQIAFHPSNTVEKFAIPVVSEIDPGEGYDFFMVPMQKQQAISFADILSEYLGDGTVVFLGNNGTGINDYQRVLPSEQILLGFLGIGGYWESDHIRALASDSPTIWIGAPTSDSVLRFNQVSSFLTQHDFATEIPHSIDGWLKCHLALILPVAGAIYGADVDNYRLARTPSLMRMMMRGIKESIGVMRTLGIKIEPGRFNTLSRLPVWLLHRIFKKWTASRESEISLAGHAGAARGEMKHLSMEFQTLIEQSGRLTPAFDKLMEYMHSEDLLVEDGSTVDLL